MDTMWGGRPAARPVAPLAAAAVLCGALAGCSGSGQQPTGAGAGGKRVPASAVRRLAVLASSFARANGDPRPAQMSVVLTTRAKARADSGSGAAGSRNGSARAYLITMRGHFTAYGASPPKGAPLPAGTYLSVAVNATTFGVLNWGLSAGPPKVPPASLGPVTHLP